MSDFRAIGGVSATLKTLLQDRMEFLNDVKPSNFRVTISTPQLSTPTQSAESPRINLFLYQVTENSALKNQAFPSWGESGPPPLSLNLHYLLTAYGSNPDGEFVDESLAHFLLGSAMRVLHDFPIITDQITKKGTTEVILDGELRGEFETIKLSLEPINLEDISKVWTALTIPYHLSVAYLVKVVQIESQRSRKLGQLVKEAPTAGPRVYALPCRSPQIESVRVRRQGDPLDVEHLFPYARIGDRLILQGSNLDHPSTRVFLGEVEVPAIPLQHQDRLEVVIPDDPALQSGPQTVQVAVDLMLGEPPIAHSGVRSNDAVFVLLPTLTSISPTSGKAGTILTIAGNRLYQEGKVCLVIFGDLPIRVKNPPPPPSPPPPPPSPNTPPPLQAIVPSGLTPGKYAVRVRVNGAEALETQTFEVTS